MPGIFDGIRLRTAFALTALAILVVGGVAWGLWSFYQLVLLIGGK